ncbi:RelA/SpoT family protein [Helicobacter saguini]|uniref:Bifunctional (P)ppGpp synthetase/guanosine-3',5'-bis(Diphosphate) 3'-pyrophosphohydrolase n=1 Tax=Helicobacter saguini TaxID=1548018 RepID=A0A4U8T657_9HELI|nr:RelA/SpoT family protein [Helicobacter saguini]MWV62395.1 RelA/SpoT family protein [Helicobacter saguini]MWV66933.1 RelA/SpoT family protein [Helicobacter saguini]MWV71163.1 RelA/SpoT family protein [Helicobacter saguini]TLD94948.1 bifunctional (p)ppGpp synthetase/guanosine-3',5'-bis(diphosphate) 3'-pyrophosphohydrolase [Helicobacter saguini]
MSFFDDISKINTIDSALSELQSLCSISDKVEQAIDDAKRFHNGQLRKSGIPYVIHPICVACIVAYYGGDEAMICAALLHDIVEDTLCESNYIYETYGEAVGNLVDALTKIVEIRNEELPSATSNEKLIAQALSFRKMLLASVKDSRVLVIKISDRMHNMLTLDALHTKKQIRISEETLVVYAPIAHRLGISSLKNELEDKSFYYIFPDKYNKIQTYMSENRQSLILRLNNFTEKVTNLLLNNGFLRDSFEIQSRVKRTYSIYLKMQRKGISIDEILDLLALRIIVKNPLDCYRVLGIIHINLKPIPSRLKDYIALPKENGYQTIHTTVFDESAVYEVQIRTFDMHKNAELGVAAHWKYKSTGGVAPNMAWLQNMQYENNTVEEFYELATNDLYKEDIVVFSPTGETFNLPMGSVVLDFAYAVHSKVGDSAKEAFVNHQKASLLQKLRSGDIVRIITSPDSKTRCTWIDSVKTSKAKSHMRTICNNKIKIIDRKVAINILMTIFSKDSSMFEEFIERHGLDDKISRITTDLGYLKDIKNQIKTEYHIGDSFFAMLRFKSVKLKSLEFDNIVLWTNRNINEVMFDYCCHPKYGDSIVAIKNAQKVIIHHKLCDRANELINQGVEQVFSQWTTNTKVNYQIIIALEDRRGIIAEILSTLVKYGFNVLKINFDGSQNVYAPYFEIVVEVNVNDTRKLKELLQNKYKIIKFSNLKDAYQG